MGWRCPHCRAPLDEDFAICANGHRVRRENGVPALLEERFAARLREFSQILARMRSERGYYLTDPAIFDALPFAKEVRNHPEWRRRGDDVRLVQKVLRCHFKSGQSLSCLDVGAYNGWLSHWLARWGHRVTGIDYFNHAHDGLGAHRFYSHTWRPVQMDLTNLDIIDKRFDVLILNHGLHFFPDPVDQVRQVLGKLAPGGVLIAIGLIVYRDPSQRIRKWRAQCATHRAGYGAELTLRPTRGYLDEADRTALQALGLGFHAYPKFWLHNAWARWRRTLPQHFYALARR